jgi:tetratricopeptide (TPR) repeat protein
MALFFAFSAATSSGCRLAESRELTDRELYPNAVESIDTLANGSSNSYRASAEYMMSRGQTDKAISFCKKALEHGDNDIDLHQIYAEALERKIKTGGDAARQRLLSECVHQWVIVLRNEAGEEKGSTFHGIGIPLVGHFYEDDERHIPAKSHLIGLVGRPPHGWETDAKYMKNVLKDQYTVAGKVVLPTN